MAKYELPIYGKDEAIIKTHEANIIPWGIFVNAAELEDKLKDMTAKNQIIAVQNILKEIFPELTDEDLLHADTSDVMNTFLQIVNGGQTIKGGSSKN